jgi:hypothetical protein
LVVGDDSTDAIYDPAGAGTPAGTTFESGVAIRFGGAGTREFLTSGSIGGSGGLAISPVTGSLILGTSSFNFGGLTFVLTQSLTPLFTGLAQTGSVVTQSFAISNFGVETSDFELVRYLDGDLEFDGSIVEGGGRLFAGSTEILFETDTAAGTSSDTTFVGITAVGGTIPVSGRYEIDSFAGLQDAILAGLPLDDTITGDGADADQFIDATGGYDVTLALRNVFALEAGASTNYTTSTYFGNGAPEDVTLAEVPEPASMVLFGLGAIGLAGVARRRRQAN